MRVNLCKVIAGGLMTASAASGQSGTISVEAPERVSPGESFTVRVLADVQGLPELGAIAGFGFDVNVSGSHDSVSQASTAAFASGAVPGTPGPTGLLDVVGGQNANVLSTNPTIMTAPQQTLFEFSVTAGGEGQIQINPSNPNPNGGLIIYTDATTGENTAITPSFAGTIVLVSDDCPADVNGDGELTPTDFGAWLAAFNAGELSADQNGDGELTPTDFGAWLANFNAGCD